MNTKKTCEKKLTLVLNALSHQGMTSAEIKTHTFFYESFAGLIHNFFTGVVTSNSNWMLIRTMDEDAASLANDCTMKFLKKLDYFLSLPAEYRIKTAVVMANNLVRDQARSYQLYSKHTVIPEEYDWSIIPDRKTTESQFINREQSLEIVQTLLQRFSPLAVTAFLGITVLKLKPAELSAALSNTDPTHIIHQVLNDAMKMMDLNETKALQSYLTKYELSSLEGNWYSADHLSDLCYETKRKLRKQFR